MKILAMMKKNLFSMESNPTLYNFVGLYTINNKSTKKRVIKLLSKQGKNVNMILNDMKDVFDNNLTT